MGTQFSFCVITMKVNTGPATAACCRDEKVLQRQDQMQTSQQACTLGRHQASCLTAVAQRGEAIPFGKQPMSAERKQGPSSALCPAQPVTSANWRQSCSHGLGENELESQSMHLFPGAAATNTTSQVASTIEMYSLSSEAAWTSGLHKGSSYGSEETAHAHLHSSWGCGCSLFLDLWQHHSHLHLHRHTVFSLRVCVHRG